MLSDFFSNFMDMCIMEISLTGSKNWCVCAIFVPRHLRSKKGDYRNALLPSFRASVLPSHFCFSNIWHSVASIFRPGWKNQHVKFIWSPCICTNITRTASICIKSLLEITYGGSFADLKFDLRHQGHWVKNVLISPISGFISTRQPT